VETKRVNVGFVAIDKDQSLKFARSIFSRRMLTVEEPPRPPAPKPPASENSPENSPANENRPASGNSPASENSKVFICEHFLVPRFKNIIVTSKKTIRYAKYARI